jgi:hypothetical protein
MLLPGSLLGRYSYSRHNLELGHVDMVSRKERKEYITGKVNHLGSDLTSNQLGQSAIMCDIHVDRSRHGLFWLRHYRRHEDGRTKS